MEKILNTITQEDIERAQANMQEVKNAQYSMTADGNICGCQYNMIAYEDMSQ